MGRSEESIDYETVYKFKPLAFLAGLIPFVPLIKTARESIRYKAPDMGILSFGIAVGEATFVGLAIRVLVDPSIDVPTVHGLAVLLAVLRLGMAMSMNFSPKEVSDTPNFQ